MASVVLRSEERDSIFVGHRDVGEGAWAEISVLLLSHDAVPVPSGYAVSSFGLRLLAVDLAQIISRHALDVDYDEGTLELLDVHRREFLARDEATRNLQPLEPHEVERLVRASGRFARQLTRNQIRDAGRLLKLAHGANFSVPGAGKTTSLLACYEALRARDGINRLLVVAPKNAFLAWEQEVEICFPSANQRPVVRRLTGGMSKAVETLSFDFEIGLITYQFLPNVLGQVRDWVAAGQTQVVLDESHRAKSGASGVYAFAALQLGGVALRRDVLSGTPIPNSPEDLRAQIEFLWPGQRVLPDVRLRLDSGASAIEEVQRAVAPLYVRTTKHELDLPPLVPVPVSVELPPLQRELYELLRNEAQRVARKLPVGDSRLLRKLGQHVMVMLEAASNPMLIASLESASELDMPDAVTSPLWELLRESARTEQPAKVAKAVELTTRALEADPTHKVLVWSSFIENVLLLERKLARFGPVTLYGAIATGSDEDADTREGRIRRFHEDRLCRVMVANPAACGEGISLHRACHHAIYVDRTFNAAHYLQSIDRIHRLGLRWDVPTKVEILEARWTIDVRVARRLKAKIDAMSIILNDPGLAALAYDPEDVIEEFPAGIQQDDVDEIVDHIAHGESRE